MNIRTRALLFAGTIVTSPAASIAHAQTSVPEPSVGIPEIMVTAQKRTEGINDVGISITALTGDELKNRNATQISDLVRVTPGLNYTQGSTNGPIFSIRGIGFVEISLSATPTVTLYQDEVPLPVPLMASGTMLDLQRVEVLKGPQGTLFGQNSTGGAINFIANRPTESLEAGFDLTYGRFNQTEVEGFVSGPITNTLRARVALRKEYADPWQISNSRDEKLGKNDRFMGRFLLDWEPTDALKVMFNVNGWQDNSDAPAGQFQEVISDDPTSVPPVLFTVPRSPERPRAADWDEGEDFFIDDDFFQVSMRADYDFGEDFTLTSISSYQELNQSSLIDADGTPVLNFSTATDGRATSFSQELRLAGRTGQVRWLIGGNYQRNRTSESIMPITSVSSFPFSAIDARGDTEADTYAVFGNMDWEISPGLTVQGGIRYTEQKQNFEGCSYDTGDGSVSAIFSFLASEARGEPVTIPPGACVTLGADFLPTVYRDELNEDNISWRLGVNWEPDDTKLIYANVSRGYKSGAFVTTGASVIANLFPATQESVLAFEAGFKLGLMGRKVQLNGAAFYYDYEDKQIRGTQVDPDFGLQDSLLNLPKARIAGAELELNVSPTRNFNVNFGATYVDSKIRGSFENVSGLGNPTELGGQSFPTTPKWQLTGDAQYDFDLNDSTLLFVGAGATYQSKTNAALGEEPELEIESYTLVNLRAGIANANDRWKITGFIRNLTNAYYYTNSFVGADALMRIVGRGRTYGVTLAYRYR